MSGERVTCLEQDRPQGRYSAVIVNFSFEIPRYTIRPSEKDVHNNEHVTNSTLMYIPRDALHH